MRSRPKHAQGLGVLSWTAAEDLPVAPSALERFSSHAGLPASEPVAEHTRSEADVRADEQPVASHLAPGC